MKVGIAGFRGAGKTTIFNALTGQHADVGTSAQSRCPTSASTS
jgi:Fe2+ transport system protein B